MKTITFKEHYFMIGLITLCLLTLYLPLAPVIIQSFRDPKSSDFTAMSYGELFENFVIMNALKTTLLIGIVVAFIAALLGLLASLAIRELGFPRTILLIVLTPLFIPGVSAGLASALLFKLLGIAPSILTIVIVQIIWALPFASLIILTVMTGFDPIFLEAAYDSGASRWRAFVDIELPLIQRGIAGAATFSFIISINETIRTSIVQGAWNTIPTYIWSNYKQVGLSPTLYALMGSIILITLFIVILSFFITQRRDKN